MSQKVEGGNEVTPLNKLSQWASMVSILCKLEPCFIRQSPNVDEDLCMSCEMGRENKCVYMDN